MLMMSSLFNSVVSEISNLLMSASQSLLLSHVLCLDHDQLILISAPGHKAIHIGADRDWH